MKHKIDNMGLAVDKPKKKPKEPKQEPKKVEK